MSVRERLALLFVLLAALAMPAAASADVTVSLSANVLRIQGDDEANMIFETSYDDTTPWFTTPAGTTLVAGPGCRQLESAGVECAGVGAATRAQIDLGAGDDLFLWNNTTVPMTIAGGDGDDDLSGSQGRDRIDGGAGNDSLVGFGGDDTIDGGDGNDEIDGSSGDDKIDGGRGVDQLNGDGEGDGEYAAKRFGDDTIVSSDGVRDIVECENGIDAVTADTLDAVSPTCESVTYSTQTASAGSGSQGGSGSGSGSSGALPFSFAVKATLPRLGRFRTGTPIRLRITSTKACSAAVSLSVSNAAAKRIRFTGKRTLRTIKNSPVPANTASTLTLSAPRSYRSKLRGRKSAAMTVSVTCRPAFDPASTLSLPLTVKR
ncbi:MAG: hypothetical protein V9E83_01765 [Baekduia sp.]